MKPVALDRRRVRVSTSDRHPEALGATGIAQLVGREIAGPVRPGSPLQLVINKYLVRGETGDDRRKLRGKVFFEDELTPAD
ncbi:MAG: hypothetical protein HY682_02885 [Chloroflexi bacterium]|nr:hypothetical protein [Chloroflexota bacterium]